ncbi:MAG TPA: NAD-dependent epimerase/dehydratase family protein, partial [Steroidobacteraceae bacterium]|nr:NAD-dependent epimerase/dehydratase family protein [Steroidobacteraceae bacterium]
AGVSLHDIRQPRSSFAVGTGRKRSGKRLLTVGTDCAVGKKYTALAIDRELRHRGIASDFRATGQTGLLISGRGIVIDAVVADFIAGAAEELSPANNPDHWDVVEGQGSLLHPSYAGVTLGLIHGTQPDALVLCTDPLRRELDDMPGFPLPDVAECATRHVEAARLTNPGARCVGVSVNTSKMSREAAHECTRAIALTMGVPCVDPMRDGVADIVGYLLGSDERQPSSHEDA